MALPTASSIASPKQASRIVLVPNREILQRRVAELLAAASDGAVEIAPPVFIFSEWVEDTAVRLRQLAGSEVPRTQDAVTGLMDWSRHGATSSGQAISWHAARQARAADRLLRHWLGDDASLRLEYNFYARRLGVREAMASSATFSAEDWLGDLAQRLARGDELPLVLPQTVTLDGFVELTPLEFRLLEALEARGIEVQRPEPGVQGTKALLVGYRTPEDEWNAAARWAKSRVDEGVESVCVVIPAKVTAPGAEARRLRQAFFRTFLTSVADRLDASVPCPFYIPSGGRLADCRSIKDAFALMRLAGEGADAPQGFPTISQWLLSPHWAASDAEGEARARLELRLRKHGLYRISLAEVVRVAGAEGLAEALPGLCECVGGLRTLPDSAAPSSRLHGALVHWGWPGPVCGEALALQTDRIHGLLERIHGLSLAAVGEALGLLKALSEDTVMPLGGGPFSRVQVLTPEVAAAGRFDAMWICHADDVNWPPPIAVNPYLPANARKIIPRTNPEGQFRYYRTLTEKLCAAAPEVLLSWSSDAGHGPRNPSGLVAELAMENSDEISPLLAEERASPFRIEQVEDTAGLPFRDEGDVDLPGGADFFRLQAACPLMAYVRYRLGAEFAPMPGPMPDPAFRGVLLHRALRVLYEGGGDARGMPDAKNIPAAVKTVLSDRQVRARLTATGLRAEEGRLRRALASWLELDGSREGFTVEALEERHDLRFGRAVIRTRFDRLDRLDDGRVFLIDYKSGKWQKSRALKWVLDRIQEVQLPLYAVGFEAAGLGEPGGLALAAVRPGDCGFDGISDHEASAAGSIRIAGKSRGNVRNRRWSDLVDHWRAQVQMLSEEILAGRADNLVYDPDALRHGELSLVLRQEFGLIEPEEEGIDAG